jgi:hypothetical protein
MLVITAWDINIDWLSAEALQEPDWEAKFIIGKSTKRNEDGSKYKLITSDIRLPIDIKEAAYLCGDEDILDEVKAEYGIA